MEIRSFNRFSCELSNKDGMNNNYNNKEIQSWTKILNSAVMKCYFLSPGCKRRIHNIWKERYGTVITKHCLYDQARMIRLSRKRCRSRQ